MFSVKSVYLGKYILRLTSMLLNPFYLIRDQNRYMYNQIKYATILMQLAYINNKIYNLFSFNLIIYLTKIKEKTDRKITLLHNLPQSEHTCLRDFVINKGATQPAHPRSWTRAFFAYLKNNI